MRLCPPAVILTFHGHPRAPIHFVELVNLNVKDRDCQPLGIFDRISTITAAPERGAA